METNHRACGQPIVAESGLLESHALSDTQRFPAACGTLAASLSKLADRRVVETHSASALPIAFKARAAPRLLDDPTWRMLTDSNRCLLQPHEFSKLVATRRGGSIHKMAESSDPASQTREGSLGLANQPGPRPVYSPNCCATRCLVLTGELVS